MHCPRKLSAAVLTASVSLLAASPALAYTYPSAIQASYLHGCEKGNASPKGCECTLSFIEARQSLRAFELASVQYSKTGKLPPLDRAAIRHCSADFS